MFSQGVQRGVFRGAAILEAEAPPPFPAHPPFQIGLSNNRLPRFGDAANMGGREEARHISFSRQQQAHSFRGDRMGAAIFDKAPLPHAGLRQAHPGTSQRAEAARPCSLSEGAPRPERPLEASIHNK